MDIKILDSHLREHLETNAKPHEIAKAMSLTSASIERVEPHGKDFIYTIEITTNRPDMVAVRGIAEEAVAVLPHFGYKATLLPLHIAKPNMDTPKTFPIHIKNDDTLVRRILGIVMEVEQGESPQFVTDRLEAAGIRSLNNLVDITNYVMLEIGHPCHVFDVARLTTKKLIIRPSKKGEKIVTLDHKEHLLAGGDIVADNGNGEIVDLLGIMGTANSVVTHDTKTILFFFDNNDPWKIRQTSMGLAIRTDAAALNEKGVDPELALVALERGVQLYKDFAHAKLVSGVLDIYPGKVKQKTISVAKEKISRVIGVDIPVKDAIHILKSLAFTVYEHSNHLEVIPPTWRAEDIILDVDVIEEVARIYGYHNIPTQLPPFSWTNPYHQTEDKFYWEKRVKDAMKYWGFTETYTYSMVSKSIINTVDKELPLQLKNPLDEEHMYLRTKLAPSFQTVLNENKSRDTMKIFELAHVYHKTSHALPHEILTLAFLIKGKDATYYHAKGILEQLAHECNIKKLRFEEYLEGGIGAYVSLGEEQLGEILVHDGYVTGEINFAIFEQHANAKKVYKPLAKYPSIEEDLAFIIDPSAKTAEIIDSIKKQSELITAVTLLDQYQDSRTFHIIYQSTEKNLTTHDVTTVRNNITSHIQTAFGAKVK